MLRFIFALLCLSPATSIRIDTSDGGYEDIVVSISQNVPYNESVVDNIKALFRCSSTFLHRATSGRVYFKHVIIQFPMWWPKRDSARALSSRPFERSDVRIELPTETYGDAPFTKQTRTCGKPGDFIQLTPGFLAQTQNFTMQWCTHTAFMFVHQWARYRYGVFDECGIPGDKRYPLIYCTQAGVLEVNACSRRIKFEVTPKTPGSTCQVDNRCIVSDNCVINITKPRNAVDSSVMFLPYTEAANHFCDDQDGAHQHNPDAPNMQNALCKQRSTCEVISQHADFKVLRKPNPSKPIQVTFTEVQQKDDLAHPVVPILDVSAGMIEEDRTLHLSGTSANRTGVSLQAMSQAEPEYENFTCKPDQRTVRAFDQAIIYAKLTKGERVFVDALVFIEVTLPSLTQAKPQKSRFRLYDNGDGNGTSWRAASEDTVEDEDVIEVDPNAPVPRASATNVPEPVRKFNRVVHCKYFVVEEDIFESQVPPADIYDLKAPYGELGAPKGTLVVELTWTWPGAHLHSGNASSIEIRASKERARLKASFESGIEITERDVVEGDLKPLPPFAKHAVRLGLPAALSSQSDGGVVVWDVYFVARVSNSAGLTSISNIARRGYDPRFRRPPEPTTGATTTEASTSASTKAPASKTTKASATTQITSSGEEKHTHNKWTLIIIAGAVIFLVVISAAFLMRLYWTKTTVDHTLSH